MPEKKCEYCQQMFITRDNQQKGRFCSRYCQGKGQQRDQMKRYDEYLANETEEQAEEWLRNHFMKFAVKDMKEDNCWIWAGSKVNGYGRLKHRGINMPAHRISWILHNGPISDGQLVLHKCDNRQCTNPNHLFLGDQTDNMRDMASKKRTHILIGEENKESVLTESQVKKIKKLLQSGITACKIAKDYKVNSNTIYSIKHGKTWKHVK